MKLNGGEKSRKWRVSYTRVTSDEAEEKSIRIIGNVIVERTSWVQRIRLTSAAGYIVEEKPASPAETIRRWKTIGNEQ